MMVSARAYLRSLITLTLVLLGFSFFSSCTSSTATAQEKPAGSNAELQAKVHKKILIVVGPSTHPPDTHEVDAAARVLKHCLENVAGLQHFEVHISEGWPSDSDTLTDLATIVFSGDRFPLAELENSDETMRQMSDLMDAGCGIVCFHYATGLNASQVPDNGDHPLLDWMGGYFATRCKHHQSIAKIFPEAEIIPDNASHPVMRGVEAFRIHDEPYINNYFGPNGMAKNVVSLATSMLPPDNPKKETVAWAIQRPDGGRGMAVVMPHFYRNWNVEPLRKMILNGITWTARAEVPADGVKSSLPSLDTFKP